MSHALLRSLTSKNPCMVRGEGVYLFDSEGKRCIDVTAGGHLLIGPPLVIAPNQVDDLLTILDEAVGAVEKEIRP
jgi:adenosylmethionine-8-amino-7-oxononanoate aminotransferase